jgi:hypothetical protein
MSRPFLIRDLEQTCFGYQSNWQGTTYDGAPVYIRLRHGHLVFNIAGELVHQEPASPFDAVMPYSELKQRARHRFVWPDECIDRTLDDEGLLFDEA